MNANLKALIKACQQLGFDYKLYHDTQNIVEVSIKNNSYLFVNWSTPLNSNSFDWLCRDKDYFYTVFNENISMPRTQAFLTPDCPEKYKQYLTQKDLWEILAVIGETFTYPLIVKKNRGSLGKNVFKVNNESELVEAIAKIFDVNNKEFDYIALAQDYLHIKKEYRVVFVNGQLSFAYEKNTDSAQFLGNISPLHWDGAKAILVEDQLLANQIKQFCAPIFTKMAIPFCGLDIAIDDQNKWWLIEANSSPGFDYIIANAGETPVIRMYETMLKFLSQ